MTVNGFVHEGAATRVVFGAGALARLPEEIDGVGARRVLVISSPGRSRAAAELAVRLGARAAAVFAGAVVHVPVATAEAARSAARVAGADACLAFGGGSAIGVAKAIALTDGLTIVAVPTTFSGSEMTPVWGLTEGGKKTTGRDRRVQPRIVIYDPLLLAGLPLAVSGPSGMNAIAHAVEALYAADASPLVALMAEEGVRSLAEGLRTLAAEPGHEDALAGALCGAWLAGACLGTVGMGLHHKLCHVLGGTFDLPHAATHAAVLPHAAAYNAGAAPRAMRAVARALGAADAPGGLWDLARAASAPAALRDLGMPEGGLERAADLVTASPYPNPRPVERDAVLELLRAAYAGRRP